MPTKDPNAPRGNCQAFFYFAKKYRAKLGKELGDNNPAVVSKELGKLWRQQPDEEKLEFMKMAGEDRKRYEREMMVYEASGQAKAWQDQERVEQERMKEAEMKKVQEWRKQQEINSAMVGQKVVETRKVEEWKHQHQSRMTTLGDPREPSVDEYTLPNQIQINQQSLEGSHNRKYSLVGEDAVNDAVSAGTPSFMRVDKSWGGPGSSHWMANKKVRYSPYSPYVRQRTTARVGGPYQVVDSGSWLLEQDQYSGLAGQDMSQWVGNTMMPTVRENENDDLAAITREFGIDTEEDNPFLNQSSSQGFLDQSQELYEELEHIQDGEQIANRQDQVNQETSALVVN